MDTKILWVSLVIFIKNVTKDGFSLWMQIRTDDGPLHGLWEFPGGGIEAGESAEMAAVREVEEEVGVKISEQGLRQLKIEHFHAPTKTIVFNVFLSQEMSEDRHGKWFDFSFNEFSTKDLEGKIPNINHQFIADIKNKMKELVDANLYEDLWR